MSNYRFEISNSFGDPFDVTPFVGTDFSVKWKKENERRFDYQKEIKEITFVKEFYNIFLDIETSQERCDLQELNVYFKCGSGEFKIYSGTFSMNAGKWDRDRCKVTFEVDFLDSYRCIDDDDDEDTDLYTLDIPLTVTRSPIYYLNVINCNNNDDCYDCDNFDTSEASGWTLMDEKFVDYLGISNRFWLYVREELWVPCGYTPTDDWISFENCVEETFTADGETFFVDKYYRPYSSEDEGFQPVYIGDKIFTTGGGCRYADVEGPAPNGPRFFFRNGMRLIDVMEALLSEICPDIEIVSDFFQWNPINETSINYVTGETNPWRNLILHQKSDVKRSWPNYQQASTKAEINFLDLLEDICYTFNQAYRIIDGVLRIEHLSFFESLTGQNLIALDTNNLLKGTKKYSYDQGALVKAERFSFMESNNIDFIGKDIEYGVGCVKGNRDNYKDYDVNRLTTDILHILEDQIRGEEKVSLSNFALLACETIGTLRTVAGESVIVYNTIQTDAVLDTGMTFNNVLSWAYLHDKLWRHGRVLINGNMNGEDTEFITSIPIIKQDPFSVIMQCNELNNFDPLNKIKAMLGWGYVDSAEFELSSCKMKLELKLDEIQDVNTSIELGDFDSNFDNDFD